MTNYVQQYNTQMPLQQPVATTLQTCPVQNNSIQATPGQTVQVPNYSGVNIQIFNPTVATPGTSPVYNVNAPHYQSYPAEYYTNQWGTNNNGNVSNELNGQNNTNNSNNNRLNNDSNSVNQSTSTQTTTTTIQENKKKEKRNIVQLTDEYIKNLETYLNSQDKEVRLMAAKEVLARLKEDDSRCDDKALTALINKMLQDPYQPIKVLAFSALGSRIVTGDDYTVKVLQAMQGSKDGYGQNSLEASDILLKMSGQVVKKEFEVSEDKKKESDK